MSEEKSPNTPQNQYKSNTICEFISRIDLIRENDWKKGLKEIDNYTDSFITDLLDSVDEEKIKDLTEIIKERRGNLSLRSDIYDQIVKLCQAILAFGAGGLGLSLAFIDKALNFSPLVQKFLAVFGTFYVELVVVSLLSLTLYMFQARIRYPFLYFSKIGNAFPFFYYKTISPSTPRFPLQTEKKFISGGKLYAKDFVKFTEQVIAETPKDRLRNELQQYFLLISYQGYNNQFSLRLTNLFLYGVIGTIISMFFMITLVIVGAI